MFSNAADAEKSSCKVRGNKLDRPREYKRVDKRGKFKGKVD